VDGRATSTEKDFEIFFKVTIEDILKILRKSWFKFLEERKSQVNQN